LFPHISSFLCFQTLVIFVLLPSKQQTTFHARAEQREKLLFCVCVCVCVFRVLESRQGGSGLVNTLMNLLVPQKAESFLTSSATIRFPRRTLLLGVS
jgi:hypothetical protein